VIQRSGTASHVRADVVRESAQARQHRLLVVDFGSQYTQLIARRVREVGVYCEIHPFDVPEGFVAEFADRKSVV